MRRFRFRINRWNNLLAFPNVGADRDGKVRAAALNEVVGKELVLTGSNCYDRRDGGDFAAAARLLSDDAFPADVLVTHTFPFERVVEAFQAADDKASGSIKVHISFDG